MSADPGGACCANCQGPECGVSLFQLSHILHLSVKLFNFSYFFIGLHII